jgi:hypothetical protein
MQSNTNFLSALFWLLIPSKVSNSSKGKSKYMGFSDDDDVFLGDFHTRYLFLILDI